MAPQKRTPAMTGALEDNSATALNPRISKAKTEKQESRPGQLVDRYGHIHGEAVLTHWSPAALRALGIHRLGDDPEGGGS